MRQRGKKWWRRSDRAEGEGDSAAIGSAAAQRERGWWLLQCTGASDGAQGCSEEDDRAGFRRWRANVAPATWWRLDGSGSGVQWRRRSAAPGKAATARPKVG
ncbi:hypothetical protein Syun_012541 [Stephania yunnanensis]|uniref:Uncharacterized protein n=1 Tax=Stephania yunnanensis TaxID=152371 RepID=A0AAP0PJK2_9MAGN